MGIDMKKRYDIIAIGECLVDVLATQSSDGGKLLMEGNPGGAPANVLAMAGKFGAKTAMIGKLGNDMFGNFLKSVLSSQGIDTTYLSMDLTAPTTLAIVSLSDEGDRQFSFYRNQTADISLRPQELDSAMLKEASCMHFGSVSLTGEPSRSATFAAVEAAKSAGALISFDPNLRQPLWKTMEESKEQINKGLSYADIVKLSEDELEFLTGKENIEDGIEQLLCQYPLKLVAVTCGPDGCVCRLGNELLYSRAFDVPVVDTTGAGDAFWGTVLGLMSKLSFNIEGIRAEELSEILKLANAAGSLVTTKKGAIMSMPSESEVQECAESTACLYK